MNIRCRLREKGLPHAKTSSRRDKYDGKSDEIYWQVTGATVVVSPDRQDFFMVDSAGKRRHVDWLSSCKRVEAERMSAQLGCIADPKMRIYQSMAELTKQKREERFFSATLVDCALSGDPAQFHRVNICRHRAYKSKKTLKGEEEWSNASEVEISTVEVVKKKKLKWSLQRVGHIRLIGSPGMENFLNAKSVSAGSAAHSCGQPPVSEAVSSNEMQV
ncbi:hypothetical protein BX600DRAFT_150752 [Xylariales sp. PMI_506]|nr:hypothetical protein BX600DRAFT_150752 [Xylariales sp. PMI_506]